MPVGENKKWANIFKRKICGVGCQWELWKSLACSCWPRKLHTYAELCAYPGKILGGLFNLSPLADFETWLQAGNEGWSRVVNMWNIEGMPQHMWTCAPTHAHTVSQERLGLQWLHWWKRSYRNSPGKSLNTQTTTAAITNPEEGKSGHMYYLKIQFLVTTKIVRNEKK